MADLYSAKRSAVARYLSRHGVVGVGVGSKIVRGEPTAAPAIRLYVAAKVEAAALSEGSRLPREIDGVPTDVVALGRLRPAGGEAPVYRTRIRPPQPGCSIGVLREFKLLSGTLGAVVEAQGRRYLLTCNHVLADDEQSSVGRAVLQPGPSDGPGDAIATLTRFVPLRPNATARVDAAIAELLVPADPAVMPPIGRLAGGTPLRAAEGMAVEKVGRATGHTTGTVFDAAADFEMPYGFGAVTLRAQILIQSPDGGFAFSGDSGSLIVERETKRAVGLLCGYSHSEERGFYGVANHIDTVLDTLSVTLAAGSP